MITSKDNQQIKNIRKLLSQTKTRYEQRVFVVEGSKMCFEVPQNKRKALYVSETYARENKECLAGAAYEIVADHILASVSDTKSPQGILCFVEMPQYSLSDLLVAKERNGKRRLPLLLLLEGIQDPGNLGTMLRAGEGAGATGIIMDRKTVDLFNPKVVRATMGTIFRMPFLMVDDLKKTVCELQDQEVCCYGTHLAGKRLYDEPDYTKATAFLIGNEGNGLSEELTRLSELTRIPMEGEVESLNAAIAASLFLFEAYRQRRS